MKKANDKDDRNDKEKIKKNSKTARIGKVKEKNEEFSVNEIKSEISRVNSTSFFYKTLKSTIYTLIIVSAIAILISTLFFPVLKITGDSMESALSQGNFVILTKTKELERGELCAFYWRNKMLVKRVIGLPGETINIDFEGNVYINDRIIDEPYIIKKSLGTVNIEFPYKIQENEYFVLGDNRENSVDSRSLEIGAISKDRMIGKLFVRVWPLNQIKLIGQD